jgi:uncharacterized delta-60 repeat protein
LDNTFGTAGRVQGRINPNYPKGTRFECVKQLSDGKILTCGKMRDSSFVARFNANGSLDTGFGLQGTAYWRLGSLPAGGSTYAKDIQVLTSGKFLVTYLHFIAPLASDTLRKTFYSIAQYNANGSLDTGFGVNGLLTNTKITYGGKKYPYTITNIGVQATGKIVVATHGYNTTTQTDKVYVYRYNTNGSTDTGFGSNGVDSAGISFPVKASPCSVLIDPSSDKILVSTTGLDHSVALLRYNTNGSLDPSFATNGKWQLFNDLDYYEDDFDPTTDDLYLYRETLSRMTFHNGQLLLAVSFFCTRGGGYFEWIPIYGFDVNGNRLLSPPWLTIASLPAPLQFPAFCAAFNLSSQGSEILVFSDNNLRAFARRYKLYIIGTLDANAPALPIAVFPNPIDEATQVQYDLLKTENITITMQDMLGRTVATFIHQQTQAAGQHTETLSLPQGLAAGTYLITVSTAETSRSIKVVKR